MNETDHHRTLTVEEAGKVLRIGRSAAYAAARTGDLPTIRVGRALRVPTHKLAELLGEIDPTKNEPRTANPELVKADDGGHHEQYSG
jgi:excisionase family DNA binding protein